MLNNCMYCNVILPVCRHWILAFIKASPNGRVCVFFADRSPTRVCYVALCRALLEFCSVARRWTMHHFPFFKQTLGCCVGQVCQLGGVVLQQSPCCRHWRVENAESSLWRRQMTAVHGGTLHRWAAAWYETWAAVPSGLVCEASQDQIVSVKCQQASVAHWQALSGFQWDSANVETCFIVSISFHYVVTERLKDYWRLLPWAEL